jgi:hypothetical protein
MFHLREIITIVCLVLLAWSLVAPVGSHDSLLVLPVIAALCVAVISVRLPNATGFRYRALDPSLASVSVRAPPKQ